MASQNAAECRRIGIQRQAVITSLCTMADCPIDCICINKRIEDKKVKTTICGHFHGSQRDVNGSRILCGYQSKMRCE